jgi:hypothetical protein
MCPWALCDEFDDFTDAAMTFDKNNIARFYLIAEKLVIR